MTGATEDAVRDALRAVLDPEIGINVVDLGLVYGVDVAEDRVDVALGVTSPTCPMGAHLAETARAAIAAALPGRTVTVTITHDPPWSPERMSDTARKQLGW